MGMASSTESKIASSTESDSRYKLTILEIMEEDNGRRAGDVKREERPEKEKLALQASAEATIEVCIKELHALFPPKLGEYLHTKRDEYEDGEVLERFSDFMKGGACKESFNALGDCLENTETVVPCVDHLLNLKKCMDAHIGYYEPILALAKVVDEMATKELVAFETEHGYQPES